MRTGRQARRRVSGPRRRRRQVVGCLLTSYQSDEGGEGADQQQPARPHVVGGAQA